MVVLSMALTPLLDSVGRRLAEKLESGAKEEVGPVEEVGPLTQP